MIVEELIILAECHIFYPGYMSAPVDVKVKLLQFVLDFPGLAKVMSLPGSGAIRACPWCEAVGTYSKALGKTVYLENRRYLHENHCLRHSSSFTSTELREQPSSLSIELERKRRSDFDCLPNENQKKNFSKQNGVKGTYQLSKLKYHRYHRDYLPDGMHTIAGMIVSREGVLA